jgi:hypothetical protein
MGPLSERKSSAGGPIGVAIRDAIAWAQASQEYNPISPHNEIQAYVLTEFLSGG